MVKVRALAGVLLFVVLLPGCGASDEAATADGDPTDGTATVTEEAAPTEEATTPEPTATDDAATAAPTATASPAETGVDGESTVAVADSELGEILTNADGETLYLFTQDSEGTSACTGDCLATWPPLEGPATAGDGVDAALLGAIERDDGTTHVTYNGHPLYTFAGDANPGDINGQGVGDVWFAVTAEGEAASTDAAAEDDGTIDY